MPDNNPSGVFQDGGRVAMGVTAAGILGAQNQVARRALEIAPVLKVQSQFGCQFQCCCLAWPFQTSRQQFLGPLRQPPMPARALSLRYSAV